MVKLTQGLPLDLPLDFATHLVTHNEDVYSLRSMLIIKPFIFQ